MSWLGVTYLRNTMTGFVGLVQTVAKLQKKYIIKVSDVDMRIICNKEEGGVHTWSYIVKPPLLPFFFCGARKDLRRCVFH